MRAFKSCEIWQRGMTDDHRTILRDQIEGAVVPPSTFASFAVQNTSDGLEWLECPVR